jgi:hypothetical protein
VTAVVVGFTLLLLVAIFVIVLREQRRKSKIPRLSQRALIVQSIDRATKDRLVAVSRPRPGYGHTRRKSNRP